jgi:hypothetical protein
MNNPFYTQNPNGTYTLFHPVVAEPMGDCFQDLLAPPQPPKDFGTFATLEQLQLISVELFGEKAALRVEEGPHQ